MNVGGVSGRGGQRRAGGAILTVGWARLPSFLLLPRSPLEVPRNHGPPATLVSAAAAASARVRSPLVPRKPAAAETATEPVVEAAVVVSLVVAPSVTSAVVPAAAV